MITDYYPTRQSDAGGFRLRNEAVSYGEAPEGYIENGYAIIKDFFSMSEINQCLNETPTGLVTKDPITGNKRSITGIHNQEPYLSVSRDSSLVEGVKSILGSDIYIHQSRINYKLGGGSNGWHWHSDFETWHAQDGMPKMNCLTAMISLTENNECNGSLMVIPGSHKVFYSCKKMPEVSAQDNFADQKEGVPDFDALVEFLSKTKPVLITCSPGDLVLFDCNLIHGSVPNITVTPRTNLFFVYNSVDNKLQAPFSASKPRPEEMGARINVQTL